MPEQAKNIKLEFTVEPFVDSKPGPHVKAAIAAASTDPELVVDVGPFGTIVDGERDRVLSITQEILTAAFSTGASRVSLQLTAD